METAPGGADGERNEVEVYLQGNVVIRTETQNGPNQTIQETLFAAEAYYDTNKNRAVALEADLDLRVPLIPDPVRFSASEIDQLGRNHYEGLRSKVSASKRPGDPGLNVTAERSVFTREFTERTNLFGLPYRNLATGETDVGFEQLLTSYGVKPRVFDVPFFYLPRTKSDIAEPLGPLAGFATANDRILGFQLYTTFDLFKLLALRGPPGHRWRLFLDYYGSRGAAIGTQYNYVGSDLFGLSGADKNSPYYQPFTGFTRLYLVNDTKKNRVLNPQFDVDILGGFRGPEPVPPGYRSRLQWQHNQDIYEAGTTYVRGIAQAEYFSDKNFYEQYYKNQFDILQNQETFAYLYGASNNLFASGLVQSNLKRRWETETNSKPRLDAAVIGESLFGDRLTYSSRASAGNFQLRPATVSPLPNEVTDRDIETGRIDWFQRIEAPLDAGPFRITPYGVLDLTGYSNDISGYNRNLTNRDVAGQPIGLVPFNPDGTPSNLNTGGTARGRFYGGGGVESSIGFNRLYRDVGSDLFNLNGLYHKVLFRANYFAAYSNTPYYQLPQLDRLNDDATDQGYRNTRPFQGGLISPPAGFALFASPLYDPQQYAIRRTLDSKVDTLDSVEVLRLGIDQRLQTKRGFPGAQHTVDWMTLNVATSVFPDKDRDNYGQSAAFYEYNFLWNVGDRTSVSSAGWYDPIANGVRYVNAAVNFTRPDGTNFYFSYRYADPIESRAVTAIVTYNINKKYAVNVLSTYDFGLNRALTNQVSLSRTGADVTLLFGVSYNALQNNFGLQFALVPNLLGISGARLNQAPLLGQR